MKESQDNHKTFSIKKLSVVRGGWKQIKGTNEGRKCEYAMDVEVKEGAHPDSIFNACDIYLEARVKKTLGEPSEVTQDRIEWIDSQGPKGAFQKSKHENESVRKLREEIERKGPFVKDGFFYWLLRDRKTIGRKREQDVQRV